MFVPRITRAAFIALAALVTAGLVPSALASDVSQDRLPSTFAGLQKTKPMDVMHMMDTGKKGYVTKEEFMKFQEALFEKIDRDGDLKLTAPEFTDQG